MYYAITRSISNFTPEIRLSSKEYDRLVDAKKGLIMAMGIEELFSNLRENYAEYEHELFQIALKNMMHLEFDWGLLVADVFTLNRRVLNFLATSRQYGDHVDRELVSVFGPGSKVVERAREAWEHERATSLEHRFMEALRNHIQHHSLPVYSVNRPNEHDNRGKGLPMLRHRAEPRLSLERLKRDTRNFSTALLHELKPLAVRQDRIPLNPMVRAYLVSLGRIHKALRDALAEPVAGWDALLLEALARARDAFGDDSAVEIGCYCEDDDDELALERPPKAEDLFPDLIHRRRFLEQRSRFADQMPNSRDYISTE